MSKLYDQLKNAAFSRRQVLEPKPRKSSALGSSPATPELAARVLAGQKVVVDSESRWRDEIEGKLHEADLELVPRPPPGLDDPESIRGREANMATLAEAAQRRAEVELAAAEAETRHAEADAAALSQAQAHAGKSLLAETNATQALHARIAAENELVQAARLHSEAQQRAIDAALAEERARAEALALEAGRRKLEAARIALGAAEMRMRAETDARALTDARRRTGSELAELRARLRARLRAIWTVRLRRRSTIALRHTAIAAAIAGIGYWAFLSGAPQTAPSAVDPLVLKLDFELRMGNRP